MGKCVSAVLIINEEFVAVSETSSQSYVDYVTYVVNYTV